MKFKSNMFVTVAAVLSLMGCRGPVATHVASHPRIAGVDAQSVQDGDKIWLELTIPHEANSEQWAVSFNDKNPEGFQVHPDETKTMIKWLIAADKVKFFGIPGFKLTAKNSKGTYRMMITVRPNYAVILAFIGGAIH